MAPKQPGGALPRYVQISELLAREIAAGIWPDGGRLPTEAELAAKLGVAVGTLRKGLAQLEQRGLLERIQGSGTYVRRQKMIGGVYSFLRLELKAGAGLPRASILSLDRVDLPDGAPTLGPDGSSTAWRVRRLRHLGETPAALEEIYFDARHAPNLRIDSIDESMYLFYRDKLGFWIAGIEDKVGVAPCPAFAAADSIFAQRTALGYVERISWSNNGTVEEFSRNWYDPETVAYVGRWV